MALPGASSVVRATARASLALAVLLPAVSSVSGCGPDTTAAPTAAPTLSPRATPTPVPTVEANTPEATPVAQQIETDWGPIWPRVPDGFPAPTGGEPTADVDAPASAAWSIAVDDTGADAREIADGYGRAFAGVGLGGGVDGPGEDGSFAAWASSGYGCDILVSVLPRGPGQLLVTVLYGAGCPFRWQSPS